MIKTNVGKTDAVSLLARSQGIFDINPWDENVDLAIKSIRARCEPLSNVELTEVTSSQAGLATTLAFAKSARPLGKPVHMTQTPDCFPPGADIAFSPTLELLQIPNGYFWNFAGCSVTLTADGGSFVEDYSSRYAGLVNFYDVDAKLACSAARFIDGPALVIADDIRPANFCHWLIDAMPRLAAFDARSRRSEWYVIVPPLTASYQAEALEMCGISRDRIVEVADNAMVRARLLVVTNDVKHMPHPAFKAAPWAMSFLQSSIGLRSSVSRRLGHHPIPRKIFVSRGDAPGRCIVNEGELTTMLAGKGYRSVSMAGLSLAEQVAFFIDATHVVGMHGAGLSHLAFTTQATSVVEIFSPTYGTPAFYVLAAAAGAAYATYVETQVVAGSRTQLDNVVVDVARFAATCGAYL